MATVFRPPIIVTIYPRRKAADEWSVNLRVLYAPNPADPFNQLDWPLAIRAKPRAIGEAVAASAPIYTPNPSRPFNQSDWFNAKLARQAQKSDAPAYFIPPKPFTEVSWPSIQRGRPAAKVDSVVNFSPLLMPNPAVPFIGLTETRTMARQSVRSDIFVNLLPLQSGPVVFPFSQADWLIVARPRFPAIVDLIERSSSLYTPNPDRPFINPIMMNSNASRVAVAIVDASVNLLPIQNFTPPPPATDELQFRRFFVDVGSLMST